MTKVMVSLHYCDTVKLILALTGAEISPSPHQAARATHTQNDLNFHRVSSISRILVSVTNIRIWIDRTYWYLLYLTVLDAYRWLPSSKTRSSWKKQPWENSVRRPMPRTPCATTCQHNCINTLLVMCSRQGVSINMMVNCVLQIDGGSDTQLFR